MPPHEILEEACSEIEQRVCVRRTSGQHLNDPDGVRTPVSHGAVDGSMSLSIVVAVPVMPQHALIDVRELQGPVYFPTRAVNSASSRIFSFSFCAFSSLEPAPGPATT